MDFEKIALKATPVVVEIHSFRQVKDIFLKELQYVLKLLESIVEDAAYEHFVESNDDETLVTKMRRYYDYLKNQFDTIDDYIRKYGEPNTSLFSTRVDRMDRQRSHDDMPKFSHAELYRYRSTRNTIVNKLKVAHRNLPEKDACKSINLLIDFTNVLLSRLHSVYRRAKRLEQPLSSKDDLDRALERVIEDFDLGLIDESLKFKV